jgi:hypothetical protein
MAKRYLSWFPKLLSDEKTILGIRYAYVVLALFSVVMTLLGILYVVQGRQANNHKFCEVITPAIVALKAELLRNSSSQTNPSFGQSLDWLIRYEHLSKGLGCPKT